MFSHSHIPFSPLTVTPCGDAQQRWGPSDVVAGGTGRMAAGKSPVTDEGVCYSKLCSFLVACGPRPLCVNQKVRIRDFRLLHFCAHHFPMTLRHHAYYFYHLILFAVSGTASHTVRAGDLGHAQPQCQPDCTGPPSLQCRPPRAQQC